MSLLPVYIFSSDDPFLKAEKSRDIIRRARQELPEAEFMIFTASDFSSGAQANLMRLENELIDPGLFGVDRIIKIYLNQLNATALQVLQLVAKRHRQGVVCVIEMDRFTASYAKVKSANSQFVDDISKLKGESKTKAVFANLNLIGAHISIDYPPEGSAFSQWLINQASKHGLTLSRETLEYLSLTCEGNLVVADQFFELVKSTTNENPVSIKTASDYLSSNSRFSGFEFAEAALNPSQSIRALNILYSLGQSSASLASALPLIISNCDKVLSAVQAVRDDKSLLGGRATFNQKMSFFRPYRITALSTMDAIIFAAAHMPNDLYTYLCEELARASECYQTFNNTMAMIHMQNFAIRAQQPYITQFREL
ncbi:MAG: DNA polymerase III subunit delta [Succinivibrio sp.]